MEIRYRLDALLQSEEDVHRTLESTPIHSRIPSSGKVKESLSFFVFLHFFLPSESVQRLEKERSRLCDFLQNPNTNSCIAKSYFFPQIKLSHA